MLNEKGLSPALMEVLSASIADRLGLHFPAERQPELVRSLSLLAGEFGFEDATACAHWLIRSTLTAEQIDLLADCLTVGETYFFREGGVFSVLEAEIFPTLIEERRNHDRRLRIWSAACSGGQEPYSIAILLDRLLPDRTEWDITILATDINQAALTQARQGIYREWSFRQAPDWLKEKYFVKREGGDYQIAAHLKHQVSFERLNLAADVYPSVLNNTCAMDLILCRNVLMYFTPECARLTVEKLYRCLNDNAWLVVGQAELSHVFLSGLIPVRFSDAIVYQRHNPPAERIFPTTESSPPEPGRGPSVKEASVTERSSAQPVEEISETATTEMSAPYSVAVSFYRRGKYAQAEKRLLQLLATQPEETRALSLLVRCIAEQGRFVEARRWCEQAMAGNQLDPALYYLLAVIAMGQGAKEDAVAALRRVLFLDPGFVMAHFAWGQLAEQSGQAGEAAKHFANARRLLQTRPSSEPLAEGDGLTVGQLMDVINRKQLKKTAA